MNLCPSVRKLAALLRSLGKSLMSSGTLRRLYFSFIFLMCFVPSTLLQRKMKLQLPSSTFKTKSSFHAYMISRIKTDEPKFEISRDFVGMLNEACNRNGTKWDNFLTVRDSLTVIVTKLYLSRWLFLYNHLGVTSDIHYLEIIVCTFDSYHPTLTVMHFLIFSVSFVMDFGKLQMTKNSAFSLKHRPVFLLGHVTHAPLAAN